MYGKGKSNSSAVPSDSQAREKLALYVYEYLLHVGAQKSAQTFLSEERSLSTQPCSAQISNMELQQNVQELLTL
uniref:Single-stranded DNA binding protein 2 n=1 Tax=Mus spicilegus TaxID=10103 RepID=A0A8C6IIL2_MUSSI